MDKKKEIPQFDRNFVESQTKERSLKKKLKVLS